MARWPVGIVEVKDTSYPEAPWEEVIWANALLNKSWGRGWYFYGRLFGVIAPDYRWDDETVSRERVIQSFDPIAFERGVPPFPSLDVARFLFRGEVMADFDWENAVRDSGQREATWLLQSELKDVDHARFTPEQQTFLELMRILGDGYGGDNVRFVFWMSY